MFSKEVRETISATLVWEQIEFSVFMAVKQTVWVLL